jgi:hypothetical protein
MDQVEIAAYSPLLTLRFSPFLEGHACDPMHVSLGRVHDSATMFAPRLRVDTLYEVVEIGVVDREGCRMVRHAAKDNTCSGSRSSSPRAVLAYVLVDSTAAPHSHPTLLNIKKGRCGTGCARTKAENRARMTAAFARWRTGARAETLRRAAGPVLRYPTSIRRSTRRAQERHWLFVRAQPERACARGGFDRKRHCSLETSE